MFCFAFFWIKWLQRGLDWSSFDFKGRIRHLFSFLLLLKLANQPTPGVRPQTNPLLTTFPKAFLAFPSVWNLEPSTSFYLPLSHFELFLLFLLLQAVLSFLHSSSFSRIFNFSRGTVISKNNQLRCSQLGGLRWWGTVSSFGGGPPRLSEWTFRWIVFPFSCCHAEHPGSSLG